MLAAAALLLPAIIALAVWFNAQQAEQRQAVERRARTEAREIMALADAEVASQTRILRLIASSAPARSGDLSGIEALAGQAIRENPDWNALVVRQAGKVVLEIAEDPADISPAPLPPLSGSQPHVERSGRYCPCVLFEVAVAGRSGETMTLFVSPDVFERIVLAHAPMPRISAIVDRKGRFVARSLNFAERVGSLASPYVRRAVERGGEGTYRGITLEGFRNYSVYTTSSTPSGWSSHVAIARNQIDSARTLGIASLGAGVLAALVLAAGLLAYSIYEMRRRKLEEQRLLGMQKAEAISRFTGMMAHDFRNILAVIDAGVRLILRKTGEEATAQHARAIGDAVERGSRMVNQLLSFVRGDGAEVETLDLQKCLSGADDLIARSLGENIDFSWQVDEDARHACGNPDQLELALLNLAINARDATNGSGEFTIHVRRHGSEAAIVACDNGPGVPATLRDRVFETFYSTKRNSGGTGLGLAQVAGAARQAGGRVSYSDRDGGGACFTIYLPLAEPAGS